MVERSMGGLRGLKIKRGAPVHSNNSSTVLVARFLVISGLLKAATWVVFFAHGELVLFYLLVQGNFTVGEKVVLYLLDYNLFLQQSGFGCPSRFGE